jgi:hypothetical protein
VRGTLWADVNVAEVVGGELSAHRPAVWVCGCAECWEEDADEPEGGIGEVQGLRLAVC